MNCPKCDGDYLWIDVDASGDSVSELFVTLEFVDPKTINDYIWIPFAILVILIIIHWIIKK